MADWSNLLQELLEKISKLFTINADYIRFRAVCSSWRSSLSHRPHHLPCQFPWLMLPYKDDDSTLRGFFNPYDNKVHWLELPEARGKRCCGSSKGWLVIVEESPSVTLLNPLTRAQIQLPPITTFPDVLDFRISRVGEEYLHMTLLGVAMRRIAKEFEYSYMIKVILSINPTSNDNDNSSYIAMAIYGDVEKAAFCRSGDSKWTIIEETEDYTTPAFDDILYYNGQFYVVDCQGRVLVCDFTNPSSPKLITITPYTNLCCEWDKKVLAELAGELLLIYRHRTYPIVKYEDGEEDQSYETLFFRVFKLNHHHEQKQQHEWVEIKSLGDDYMLFLGDNCALCLSAKDFPGCKANCIYFTDDEYTKNELFSNGKCGGHDLGVFNMEDQSIEPFPCYIEKSRFISMRNRPMWVTPSLY